MLSVRWLAIGAAVAFGTVAVVTSAAPESPRDAEKTPRDLYVANCAACHGETGDGKGTTKLERPARSFKDGGFSYGNTPEALLRTITYGIPGSLMPSFGEALKEPDRKTLASYVISLGPPTLNVEAKDTVMVVRDRAVVVRGKLPPIVEGAPERPRGLLIGLPSGLSFEYRTDDVRLLGVRTGEFVDRTDWIGRGGSALQPLGHVVHVVTIEPAPFTLAPASRAEFGTLEARLVASVVDGVLATVTYDLVTSDGHPVARVLETPAAIATTLGPGWKRTFVFDRRRATAVAFRAAGADAQHGRIDAQSAYASLAAGPKLGFDVTIVRGRVGNPLADTSLSFADGLVITPAQDTSSWTCFEIPSVDLPDDIAKRTETIAKCARELQ